MVALIAGLWRNLLPESAQDAQGRDQTQRRGHQRAFGPPQPFLPRSQDDYRQTYQSDLYHEPDVHERNYYHHAAAETRILRDP